MLGVHNPRTNTLTLHSAPLHTFSTSIKALKAAPGTLTSSQFSVQKALLGTTFGTRKAIRAINTQARNKLDESSFGTGTASLQAHLQSSIAASTTSLPTADAIEHAANVSRPIPPPNFDATKPGDVYVLDKVVSDAELTLVDIAALIRATQVADRNRLLPFRRSKFITNRMREILPNRGEEEDEPTLKSNDRLRLRILVHLSHMFAFRQATMGGGREINVTKLKERFGETVDEAAIVALVERFSETHKTSGGGKERRVTGVTEVKLLGYLLVLVLKVDGWSTDVTTIATDLGMGAQKYVFVFGSPSRRFELTQLRRTRVQELFKSLGCAIMTPSADERQKLISSGAATTDAEARKRKRAVLKVPLEFPKERRGVPKR